MSLAAGARLGSYEIVGFIGAGGMGEVYKGHDTRLKRDVAIKTLPEIFARDPERLSRFQREAELLASLNHPHIAHIHGLEETGHLPALVMEFVEGEDLAQKIARGPIPWDQTLGIAGQIADALEAAHGRGIIHRDLKPSNIKITPAGDVKVLDFGLAKAIQRDGEFCQDHANSPTITSASTKLGVILGTAAYMSPEQAKGKTVDKRGDIWAFGCVLFEMLSGRPVFAGDTATEVVANVLTRQPHWDVLPADLPAPIKRVIRRCLEKDPNRRLRDIGDARADIEEASSSHSGSAGLAERPSVHKIPTIRRRLAWLAAGIVATAGVTLAVLSLRPAPGVPAARPVTRLTMPLTTAGPLEPWVPIALSPDGRQLVYRVNGSPARLYVRSLDGFEARPLAGTEGGFDPFFSPDGLQVGFTADGKLKSVAVAGGIPQVVCDLPVERYSDGADWQPDGTIFFSSQRIWRVPASGGTPSWPISGPRSCPEAKRYCFRC
jgi:eukaryotic-like serine/threonine-protein kinase